MAIRPITIVGHKALHSPTKRVKEITDDIRTLVADMIDTSAAADGARSWPRSAAARAAPAASGGTHVQPGI